MTKVMTIVGTRPELIKMSRVIKALDESTDHVFVHSGQNYDYELNKIFFDELDIRKPDYFLEVAEKDTSEVIANIIRESDKVFEKEKPDALLIYGDTNTGLAVIPAKRRRIPVFHMEAGNRCFDQRVPEELNRKIIDHLSDINMVLTEHARRYLIAEGIRSETIIKTGSHMKEVLDHFMPNILRSESLDRLDLEENRYFLVSLHREENVDSSEKLIDFIDTINAISNIYEFPIIVSTHPRTRKRLDDLENIEIDRGIRFERPFGFFDYVRLQMSAACVLSDSGTITEEASLLNTPAITLRDSHERPEGMDEGVLVMSGLRKNEVIEALDFVITQNNSHTKRSKLVSDYDAKNVSMKVVNSILSYVKYINRTVWFEE